MTSPDPRMHRREDGSPREDLLARLIRSAGRRPPVPFGRAERVKAAVRAEWAAALRNRRRRILYMSGAGAAAALIALALFAGSRGWFAGFDGSGKRRTGSPEVAGTVGTIETAIGTVRIAISEDGKVAGAARTIEVGGEVPAGAVIETPAKGRAALRLAGGQSMRIDGGTKLLVSAADAFVLEEGAVYVDSGTSAKTPVEVRTPLGTARDAGTQFEVRLTQGTMLVRVREGKVELKHEGETAIADAGVELAASEGRPVVRRTLPASGPTWEWVAACPPAYAIEGRTLREFLRWACREAGWRLSFADADSEKQAGSIRIHGAIDGMTVEQALAAVLPACGASHGIKDGALVVAAQANSRRQE